MNTDAWRFSQLWKSLSNRRHPFSHFSTGNLETLIRGPKAAGVSVHEAVRKFADERSVPLPLIAGLGFSVSV